MINAYSKFRNVLNPRLRRLQQQQSMIQNSTAYDEDEEIDEDERINAQFEDSYSRSSSDSMTAAERAANRSGGVFFNMQRYLKAMEDNDNAPRPQMDALTKHLSAQPQRESYRPTKLSRLGAMMTGAGVGLSEGPSRGIAAGQAQLHRPYMEARQDWMDKSGPLEHAAQLESQDFARKNTAAQRGLSSAISMTREQRMAQNAVHARQMASDKNEREKAYNEKRIEDMTSAIWQRRHGIQGTEVDANGYILFRTNGGGMEPTGIKSIDWTKFVQKKEDDAEKNRIASRNSQTSADTLEQRKAEEKGRDERAAKVTPAEHAAASQQALAYMYGRYSKFMTQSPTGEHVLNPAPTEDADMVEYQTFLERYKEYIDLILSGKNSPLLQDKKIPRTRNR